MRWPQRGQSKGLMITTVRVQSGCLIASDSERRLPILAPERTALGSGATTGDTDFLRCAGFSGNQDSFSMPAQRTKSTLAFISSMIWLPVGITKAKIWFLMDTAKSLYFVGDAGILLPVDVTKN